MYYIITLTTVVVLFDIACIWMAWCSLQYKPYSELRQELMAAVFIVIGVEFTFAMAESILSGSGL